MICHEVDYNIMGSDMQIVEVELDPGEAVLTVGTSRSLGRLVQALGL